MGSTANHGKLSDAQSRVLKQLSNGQVATRGAGSSVLIGGNRACNTDTMMSLLRAGLVEQRSSDWRATNAGRALLSGPAVETHVTPEYIISKLRQRIDLAEDDTSQDADLNALTPMEKFCEVVGWEHGDPRLADQMLTWAIACGIKITDPR